MEEENKHRTGENRREAKNGNTFFIVSIRTISIISIAVEKSAEKRKVKQESNCREEKQRKKAMITCCKAVSLARLILPPFSTV